MWRAFLPTFRDALSSKDFVLTAGLDLPPSATRRELEYTIDGLAGRVDAFQIAESPDRSGRMAPLAVAAIVLARGADCVVELSARDRNRVALKSELLGAAALGVTSMVLVRGEKFSVAVGQKPRGIFELGATEMLQLASGSGPEASGEPPQDFLLGTAVTLFRPESDWKPRRLIAKLDAGARFLQSQPCLNPDLAARYVERLVRLRLTHRASVLVNVPLLASAGEARTLRNYVPGAALPEDVIRRLDAAKDPAKEGVSMAADMLARLRETPGVAGARLSAVGSDRLRAVLDATGL